MPNFLIIQVEIQDDEISLELTEIMQENIQILNKSIEELIDFLNSFPRLLRIARSSNTFSLIAGHLRIKLTAKFTDGTPTVQLEFDQVSQNIVDHLLANGDIHRMLINSGFTRLGENTYSLTIS